MMAEDAEIRVRLARVEGLLARWLRDDAEMRERYGVPLLGGALATCAAELREALD